MKKVEKKRVKAGTSKAAAGQRKIVFARAYLANGMNGREAAVAAGLSPRTAYSSCKRLIADPVVIALIEKYARESAKIAGLDLDRTLREVARLAYSDPRKLYRPDGSIVPVSDMDDDTAATVASVEVDEIRAGGANVSVKTVKIKQWDKNAALEKAMKYHGLYAKDNEQKPQVVIVATPLDERV